MLVVDDEPNVANSLALILTTNGYTVRVAYAGDAAVSIAQDFRPHALISDVVMPGMSGIHLALWLSQICPDTRVLLISGNADAVGLVEEATRRGYHHSFLPKPVHPTTILNFVASCAAVF